jgi:hypothetical protein
MGIEISALASDTPVYLELIPSDTPNPFEQNPEFTLDGNAFCRAGYSMEYHEMAVLLKGSSYPVIGQNEDGSWLLLSAEGFLCWVSEVTGVLKGSLGEVEFVVAPTKTPIVLDPPAEHNCAQYTDEFTCLDHAGQGCIWVIPTGPAPYCTHN